VNGSQMSWKNPNLATGRSRWQVLQIRQLQRIGIEALLSWFEFRLQTHLDRDTDAIARQAEMELASASDIFPAHQTVGECLESFSDEAKDLDDFLHLAGSSDLWNPPPMVQALRNITDRDEPIPRPNQDRSWDVPLRGRGRMG
jgi:hypothetical protein